MNIIVDFIGAPGAGKSTLKHTVVDFLNRRGVHASLVKQAGKEKAQKTFFGQLVNLAAPESFRSPLLWRIFYPLSVASRLPFIVQNPRLMQLVYRALQGRPKDANLQERRVLPRFLQLAGFYQYLIQRCAPGEAIVFDEGFIQRVILLFASEVEVPDQALVHRYLDLIPKPNLVVYTYAPPEVCKKRILDRGLWGWSTEKTDDQISRFIDHAILTVEIAVDYIEHKRWPLVRVNNENDGMGHAEEELRKVLGIHYPETSRPPYSIPVGMYR